MNMVVQKQLSMDEGIEIGLQQGRWYSLVALIRKKMHSKVSASEIAEFMEENISDIESIMQLISQYPEENDIEIASRLEI